MNRLLKAASLNMAVAAALLMAPTAYADWDGHGGKGNMEEHVQKVFDKLGLSAEQKKQLKENREKHRAGREAQRKAMKENMKAMGEELKKQDYDVAKVTAIVEQGKQLHNQMADEHLAALLEVRKILTSEQFAKFSRMMEEKRKHFKAGRHN